MQQGPQIGVGGEVADEQQHDSDQTDARHRQAQRQHQIARRDRPGRRHRGQQTQLRQQYADRQRRTAEEGGAPAEQIADQRPRRHAAHRADRDAAEDQRGGAAPLASGTRWRP